MAKNSKSTPVAPVEAHPSDDFQLVAQHAGGYCGQVLKNARERQGLSIENIAGRLRLSVRQINAIETDDIAQLPQASTVRGFIRNYAKELKIDPVPLIEAFNKISPDKAPQALTLEPSTDMAISSSDSSKLPSLMWMGFSLIAGLGIWWAMQYFGTKTPTPAIAESAVVNETVAPALPANEPAPAVSIDLNTPASSEVVATLPTPAAPAVTPPNVTPPNTELVTHPAEAVTIANPTISPANVLPDANNNTRLDKKLSDVNADLTPLPAEPIKKVTTSTANLSITTTEETWVNVVDANGREVYSKLLSAGTSEEIAISKPLSMTIGNATGATLIVDGAPMTLNTRVGSKVARVRLK